MSEIIDIRSIAAVTIIDIVAIAVINILPRKIRLRLSAASRNKSIRL